MPTLETPPARQGPEGGPSRASQPLKGAVSWRSILLGFLLLPLFDYLVLDMEVRTSAVEPTDLTLVAPAVVALFLLVGMSALCRRVLPKAAFSARELLVVFSILMLGVSLSSMNALPTLVFLISYGTEYATLENGWADRLLPHFPDWLVVKDTKLVHDWYAGYGSLYQMSTFLAWAKPLSLWMVFVGCLVLAAYCINTIFWRQWSKSERLTFPVIQLPMAMVVTGPSSLYRKRLFWIAFSLAGAINLVNGLSFLYPSIPPIQTAFLADLGQAVAGHSPWQAIGWTPINLYPFVIGLGFMMPLDLLLSFVVFYWVWKLERVIGMALGVEVSYSALLSSGYPHYRQQMMGVWIAILVSCIYTARLHLRGVWLRAWGDPRGADDRDEPVSYRFALIGALVGTAGMTAFLIAAGMAWTLSLAFVLTLLGMYVAIARIRCELGPPCQDIPASGPDVMLSTLATPQTLGMRSNAVITSLFFLNAEHYRTAPSGTHLESLHMIDAEGRPGRRLWIALLLATILGGIVGVWGTLHMGYLFGGGVGLKGAPQWYAWQSYTRLDAWESNPTEAAGPAPVVAGVLSFCISMLLLQVRHHVLAFQLNPIAYAVTGYWTGDHFWFPILVAYLCKALTLRYSGLLGYRNALPFFQGLILGEFTVGMGWQVVALILKSNVYTYWR
ncbi:MAG TPA: DUF6785 family protein [Armatimonadota bacterium]